MSSNNIKPKFEELKNYIRNLEGFKKYINAKNKIWKLHFPQFSEFDFLQVISDLNSFQEIIGRSNVKCVFIGKTSSGKSAVINSILGKSLLPSEMGSTTSCYINIQGCDKDIVYLLDKNENELNIEQLDKANKDVDNCYSNKDTLKLCFPKSKCGLLMKNIELIDTPGLDTEETDDVSTDKCCEDAELFILVLDCNTGPSETEKAKIKSKISKKNIIILMNKWDMADQYDSEKKNRIKKKLDDMASSFLTDLKINVANEEIKPIFFVSASRAFNKNDEPFEDFQRYLLNKTSKLLKSKVRNSIRDIDGYVIPAMNLMDNSPTKNLKEISVPDIDNCILENFSNFKMELKKICTEKAKEVVPKLKGKKKEILEIEKDIVEELSFFAREEFPKKFSTLVTNLFSRIKNKLILQCGTRVSTSDMDFYFSGSNDLNWACKEFQEKVEQKIKAIKSDVEKNIKPSKFCDSCFGIIIRIKSLEEIIKLGSEKLEPVLEEYYKELLLPMKTRMEKCLHDSVEMFNKDVKEIKKMESSIEEQRNQCLQLVEDIKMSFNAWS